MPDLHASIETFLKMTPGHKTDVTLSRDFDITMGIPSKSDALVLGDVAGHEFHGNQYTHGGDLSDVDSGAEGNSREAADMTESLRVDPESDPADQAVGHREAAATHRYAESAWKDIASQVGREGQRGSPGAPDLSTGAADAIDRIRDRVSWHHQMAKDHDQQATDLEHKPAERQWDFEIKGLSLDVPIILGDVAGHEFHGNQYSQAAGDASRLARVSTGMLGHDANRAYESSKNLEDDANGVNGNSHQYNHKDLAARHAAVAGQLRDMAAKHAVQNPGNSSPQWDNLRKAAADHQAASAAHNKAAKNDLDDDGDFDKASDNARDATNEAWDKNTPELHEAAAVSNRHAAEVGKETLDNFPDAPHVPYPPSRFADEGYEPLEKHLEARGAIQKAIKAHLSDAVEHETIAAAHAATKAANAGDHGDYEGNEAKHNAATDAWTKVADMMHAAGRSPQDVREATVGPLMHHSGQAYHYHKMIQREKE